MKYASIVPLIGGETIGLQQSIGHKPEYLLSYEPFAGNDSHLVEYYGDVDYSFVGDRTPTKVDIVNTVCPCAGLSSLSPTSSSDNPLNDWMLETAQYVLSEMKPSVFWGENAPRFASKMGKPIVDKLRAIGKENGYTMSIYRTKSLLHGLPQVRDRCFYFFWKGTVVPEFPYFDRDMTRIDDLIRNVTHQEDDPMNLLTNENKPSDDPYYKLLAELEKAEDHESLVDSLPNEKHASVLSLLEEQLSWSEIADEMKSMGNTREYERCMRRHAKITSGKNIMRKHIEFPREYIGSFVGHLPFMLTHPDEDRYLTYRECLSIMKMPDDFNIIDPKKNLNHLCQNVPVTTAKDISDCVIAHLEGHLETHSVDFMIQNNKTQKLEEMGDPLRAFF